MSRAAVRYSRVFRGDDQLETELWSKTILEVEKGWLVGRGGRYCGTLPKTSVVSKRFPLMQGEKLRPIDDYCRSQVNFAISIYEQVTRDENRCCCCDDSPPHEDAY